MKDVEVASMEKFYGRLIMATAVLLGVVYAVSCFFEEFRIIYHKYIPAPPAAHPILLFIMGATFGIALMCFVAPASFLQSKRGEYYFEVIGITNMPLFRMKCLLLCVLFGTVTWTVCWMVIPDLLANNGLLAP